MHGTPILGGFDDKHPAVPDAELPVRDGNSGGPEIGRQADVLVQKRNRGRADRNRVRDIIAHVVIAPRGLDGFAAPEAITPPTPPRGDRSERR